MASAQGDEAKTVELAPSGYDVNHSHVNRDLVAEELLQYASLILALTSHSKQALILLTHRSK